MRLANGTATLSAPGYANVIDGDGVPSGLPCGSIISCQQSVSRQSVMAWYKQFVSDVPVSYPASVIFQVKLPLPPQVNEKGGGAGDVTQGDYRLLSPFRPIE